MTLMNGRKKENIGMNYPNDDVKREEIFEKWKCVVHTRRDCAFFKFIFQRASNENHLILFMSFPAVPAVQPWTCHPEDYHFTQHLTETQGE